MVTRSLSEFEKEIEHAIFESKILRNQLGIEILGPQNWKQNYKVFYKNISSHKLKYVGLTPRKKKVQRNLSVYDNMRNRTAVIPSGIVEEALCEICDYYVTKANETVDKDEDRIIGELLNNRIDFSTIFCHNGNEEVISTIHQRIARIASQLEESGKEDRDSYFFINRILALVGVYDGFYIPIVMLNTPVEKGECFIVSYSVENLEEESMTHRSFYFTGTLNISFRLEVEESVAALHKREGPRIEVSFGISRNFPWRLSLVRILTILLYISIFIPAIALFVFRCNIDSSIFIETMILVVTILISLGIYAIDRTFLHEYIASQIILLITLFIAEVVCLSYLC